MEEPDREESGPERVAECLMRCETDFERCASGGVAFSDCNELHTGCITGCDSSIMTQ
jgi:hypothetical protein